MKSASARYAPPVVRARTGVRYAFLALSCALSSACGASAVPVVRPRAEALPVSENQQGHPDPGAATESGASMSSDVALVEQPSIAGVYLWCQMPSGRACQLAAAALGTGPKDASGLPPSVLNVEDLENDCAEPTIAEISQRLTGAFATLGSGWRDQTGSYLDSSLLADMYSAAGCINDADSTQPIAKISAGSAGSPRYYLVRVWDGGGGTFY